MIQLLSGYNSDVACMEKATSQYWFEKLGFIINQCHYMAYSQ